jgi:hypothetical protein
MDAIAANRMPAGTIAITAPRATLGGVGSKSFLSRDDDRLVTVLRYVARNALRAELVSRAEDWK